MNASARRSRPAVVLGLALATVLVFQVEDSATVPPGAAQPSKPAACTAPPYRQFDFWIGNWDVFEAGNPASVATVRVDLILDGCVVREQYDGADGVRGQSLSIYDATRQVWHQTWTTNRGRLLTIEGGFTAGEMVLSGVDRAPGGQERHIRGTWKPATGSVREIAVTSLDGGKTWQPWFDLMFRPPRAAGH